MTEPIGDFGIFASAETWSELRRSPAFLELVRLARIANALSLSYPPMMVTLDDQSPRARRERFAALTYAGALMQEGLHTAQGLGQHFRQMQAYRDGFGAILGDSEVVAFRSDILSRLRNEFVFHIDRDVLAEGLKHFPEGECLIVTAPSENPANGEIYYDLADDALLAAAFGDAPTEQEYDRRVGHLLERTVRLFSRFNSAAHNLLLAALLEMGCYMREHARPDPPSDDASPDAG